MLSSIILHTERTTSSFVWFFAYKKMALRLAISTAALIFLMALASVQLSTCQVLIAQISCLDCNHNYDFSGIKVAVRCDKVKKLTTSITDENGSFKIELPLDISKSNPRSRNCLAKILGGPNRLYGKNKNLVSKVVIAEHEVNTYTTSTPLAFSTSCPLDAKSCGVGSSKTVDLPIPPEWGFAPTSYYVPFFPIIGIP